MKVIELQTEPIFEIAYLNASRRSSVPNVELIPVQRAVCSGLPNGIDSIIATADLQGLEHWETADGQPPRLVGEVVPDILIQKILQPLAIDASRTGILLCGDFYTVPGATKLGGTGNVSSVWQSFGERFRWVAGVAGNHDTFDDNKPERNPNFGRDVAFLDGNSCRFDGLCMAGISGTIGDPKKLRRRTVESFCTTLGKTITKSRADVVLMHDGPDGTSKHQRGCVAVRELLERRRPPLVIRGHCHWDDPLVELDGGTQVLNVDCRVVVMTKPEE